MGPWKNPKYVFKVKGALIKPLDFLVMISFGVV